MNFTLDQLLALDAISRTGSFAKAASELHKVPSAISYSIQSLESALGVDVFDRSRRKAVLTDAGIRVLEVSREVIERARALERVAAELEGGWEPELHVVVDGALPMEPFLRCLRRFSDPDVPTFLRLDVEYQEGVVERLNEAPADLAMVLGLAFDGDEEGYECTPLDPLDFVLVAGANHPLAEGPAGEEERRPYAEIVVRDSSSRFSKHSKGSFMGSKNVVFLSDFHSKRIALLQEAGFGWVPRHLVEEDLKTSRLVLLDAEPNSWTYRPQMLVRTGHALGMAAQLFVETMVQD